MLQSPITAGLAVLLGAAAVGLAVLWPEAEPEAAVAGRDAGGFQFAATFVEAQTGEVREAVSLVGDVVSSRRTELAFERAGRISAIEADLGDEVTAGTLLAQLDDAVLVQDLSAAEAEAEATAYEAALAEREARRSEDVGADVVPEAERDRMRALASIARTRARRREAEVDRLEALLEQGRLLAPFDCVVSRRPMSEGGHANVGDPVFEVVDLARREVHLEVSPSLIADLRAGAPVTLRADEVPGQEWQARIDTLVPAADPGTRTFTAVVRLAEADDPERRLLPGMFVRAEVVRREVRGAIVVPEDSLLEGEQGIVVVVADAGEKPDDPPLARFAPVRVLARGQGRAAVDPLMPDGLAAGSRVLVTGADNAFPGAPLALVPHEAPREGPGE